VIILLIGLNACATATPAPSRALPTAQPQPTAAATATPAPSRALPTAQPQPTAAATRHCSPTNDDGVSPTYAPNMPVRNVVGHGHVLTGVVRSSRDCTPIANATLEFWPEEANKGHPDTSRATLFSDQAGHYRFECNPPEHIHMRISAPGYRTIGNNSYHPNGSPTGTFDIILVPDQ
jgi:protocatechuate 3,4-dioxygenase beta subunit